MIKIGFIDYYLDEWHANNYPELIKKLSNGEASVVSAYGKIDSPITGMTTAQWCEKMGLAKCDTREELIDSCDCIVVLSPDNPEMHLELCNEALKSSKRVFVDKTFAPDSKTARELISLANEHNTPMYSTSALRFSSELSKLPDKKAEFVSLCGPGLPDNYLIHQLEPMIMAVKMPAKSVRYTATKNAHHFEVCFGSGVIGNATLMGNGPFQMTCVYEDGEVFDIPELTGFFDSFIQNMLCFFKTGEGAVDSNETLCVAKLIEMAKKSMKTPDTWVSL